VVRNHGARGHAAGDRQKLNAEIVKFLASDDMKEKLKAQGAEPAPTSPEQFDAFIRAEWTKYAKIVKDSGAKVD
jgi:tripartite-type tricarboxylate transporter receptor subunit TctC